MVSRRGRPLRLAWPRTSLGLGFLHGGEYSGFDISVAQYVANTLGFAKKQIVFKQVLPSTRVSSLEDGTVDMVVDAFAADDVQDGEVELAGPYLTVMRHCWYVPTVRNHHRNR